MDIMKAFTDPRGSPLFRQNQKQLSLFIKSRNSPRVQRFIFLPRMKSSHWLVHLNPNIITWHGRRRQLENNFTAYLTVSWQSSILRYLHLVPRKSPWERGWHYLLLWSLMIRYTFSPLPTVARNIPVMGSCLVTVFTKCTWAVKFSSVLYAQELMLVWLCPSEVRSASLSYVNFKSLLLV